MPTATLEVGVGGESSDLYFSVSQITKFTSCEERWLRTKTTPREEQHFAKSDALDLGTLVHTLKAAWWSGKPWREAWVAAAIEAVGAVDIAWKVARGKLVELDKGWQVPTVFHRAIPIMEAWDRVHGVTPAKDSNPHGVSPDGEHVDLSNLSLVATEMPFDLPIPGVPGTRIRGFLDGIVSQQVDDVRVHDVPWLVEEKTMGRWGRENQVAWDPQLHVYGWAARQMLGVRGAIFEAISTYDYKTPEGKGPEAVDGKRFKRIALVFDDRQIERTMENVRRVARRAKQLIKNPGLAVRNAGDACTYCDFRRECLTPWADQ